jgi:hypothetical protein
MFASSQNLLNLMVSEMIQKKPEIPRRTRGFLWSSMEAVSMNLAFT